jgi:hypothetical protein
MCTIRHSILVVFRVSLITLNGCLGGDRVPSLALVMVISILKGTVFFGKLRTSLGDGLEIKLKRLSLMVLRNPGTFLDS